MIDDLLKIVYTMNSIYDLDISKYDEFFLEQITDKRRSAFKKRELSSYIKYLSDNKAEAQNLFCALNITYTDFFRNPLTFAHLEQWILPRLIEKKSDQNELRVWSAGCSTGQEAYSIAMLIKKINAKNQKPLRYRIIASDISESALAIAKKGEYNEEEVQNIRLKDLRDFFVKSGERYTVCERIKKHVSFSNYDLLDNRSAYPHESIFGNFDLVLCCNVLFYFNLDSQLFIQEKLINSTAEQGYIITGEAERQTVAKNDRLQAIAPPSPIFQKRIWGVR